MGQSVRDNADSAWNIRDGAGKCCHMSVGTRNHIDLIFNLWILSEPQLFLGSLN